VIDRLRSLVAIVPPILRPLVFLIGPALTLHALLLHVPDAPRRPGASAYAAVDAPSTGDVRRLVQESAPFQREKIATCPASGTWDEMSTNKLYNALRQGGYLTSTYETSGDIRLQPTGKAYRTGIDWNEQRLKVVVGKRVLGEVMNIDPPPQPLPPPLDQAARVEFTWKWVATSSEPFVADLLPNAGNQTGTAYFRRDASGGWRLAQVIFNDITPELTPSP